MPLLPSPRHTPADLKAWSRLARLDRIRARDRRWPDREAEAMAEIRRFFDAGPGYVGVSWGKDSVVVAHLARRVDPAIPLCWVITPRLEMPECWDVRDAFLAAHPGAYHEYADHDLPIVADPGTPHMMAVVNDAEVWPPARDFGPRYCSGLRADESGARRLRMRGHGLTTARTCAPIGWWSGDDVYAYAERHGLPVHPAYAMTRGGGLDRERLRVAPLGIEQGLAWGSREWERHYWPDVLSSVGL